MILRVPKAALMMDALNEYDDDDDGNDGEDDDNVLSPF